MQSINTDKIQPSVRDIEIDGRLNLACSNRAQFELLLSMLESDFLDRPSYDDADAKSIYVQDAPVSHYRKPSLSANQESWSKCQLQSELIHSDLANAALWNSFHPQPLAIKNDANHIAPEVIANCALHTQRKLNSTKINEDCKHIQVEEIGLYDILQSMN